MFGINNGFNVLQRFRKKPVDPNNQIPYQVYETVHEPIARRKRWIRRLVIALVVVTVAVIGYVLLDRSGNGADSNQPASEAEQSVQQSPQNNPQLSVPAGSPAKTPLSDNTNDRTVVRPE